jgi:allantoinase
VGIAGGQIVELAPEISTPTKDRLDAAGKQLFPATIDSHVHFNDPGRAHWEGIATGSAALAVSATARTDASSSHARRDGSWKVMP